jgi:aspartokinase
MVLIKGDTIMDTNKVEIKVGVINMEILARIYRIMVDNCNRIEHEAITPQLVTIKCTTKTTSAASILKSKLEQIQYTGISVVVIDDLQAVVSIVGYPTVKEH